MFKDHGMKPDSKGIYQSIVFVNPTRYRKDTWHRQRGEVFDETLSKEAVLKSNERRAVGSHL